MTSWTLKTGLLMYGMVGLLLSGSTAMAGTGFRDACPTLTKCIEAVSKITGDQYIFGEDIKGKVQSSQNLEIGPTNADLLLTQSLNLNGMSRVPMNEPGTYTILKQREARDSNLPVVEGSKDSAPALPQNWDLYTLRYKATHPEALTGIARTARSFMPANSRIIPVLLNGTMMVTDTSINLKKLYHLIRELDVKPPKEYLKEQARRRQRKKTAKE